MEPQISDSEKSEWLSNPFYADKFKFQLAPGSDKPKVPEPVEAKAAPQPHSKSEKD